MADIFISYARKDRQKVAPLGKALQDQGWTVFWDRVIAGGKTWDEVIEEELEAASCVVVVWSKHGIASRWVRAEAEEGLNRNILVPVSIERLKPPLLFRPIQAVQITDWDEVPTHPQFLKLISDLEAILGTSPLKKKEAERKLAEDQAKKKAEAEAAVSQEKRRLAEEDAKRRQSEEEAERKAEEQRKRKEVKAASRSNQADIERKTKEDGQRKDALMGIPDKDQKQGQVGETINGSGQGQINATVHTKTIWLPIGLISIGWYISALSANGMNTAIIGYNLSFLSLEYAIKYCFVGAIRGAIGGVITAIALRYIVPGIQFKQVLYIVSGWTIGEVIHDAFNWIEVMSGTTNLVRSYYGTITFMTINAAISGAIGGFVTVKTIKLTLPTLISKKIFVITTGWCSGWFIGRLLTLVFIQPHSPVIGQVICWTFSGAIGAGVMFKILADTMHGD